MNNTYFQWISIILLAIVAVIFIDYMTVELTETEYVLNGDRNTYIRTIHEGFNATDLKAPYSYRFGFILFFRFLIDVTGLDDVQSFKVMAIFTLVIKLILSYTLSRIIVKNFWVNLFVMVVMIFSFANVRYYLFDPARPDVIHFIFTLISFILLQNQYLFITSIVSLIGLTVREFSLATLAVIIVLYLSDFYQRQQVKTALKICLIVVCASIIISLPRLLINVSINESYLNSPGSLIGAWLDPLRLMNILLINTGYFLPVILLTTNKRWQNIRNASVFMKVQIIVYGGMVILLSVYGGTDLQRFMSHQFIPLILVLTLLLANDKTPPYIELSYVLLAMFIYHGYWRQIPYSLEAVLEFTGPYYNNVTPYTLVRLFVLANSMIGMEYLRRYLNRNQTDALEV